MANRKRVPDVRFKGFEGEWEEKELGSVALFTKGHGYSKNDLVKSGTPIILYGRLYTNYQTAINEVDTYVTAKENSVYSKGNEVIIPASGETAEDISRAAAVIYPDILIGSDLNIITPSTQLESIFLALRISNGQPQKELSKRAQGKSIVHLHNSDFCDVSITYPTVTEQSQIGSFFQNLDALITQRQKKLDKLVSIKKAMLEKMFPKDGTDEPELRFKGCSGKWERRNLGEMTEVLDGDRGKNYPNEDDFTSVGHTLFLSATNVTKNGFVFNYNQYITEEKSNGMGNGRLMLDDIVLTSRGSIGNIAWYNNAIQYKIPFARINSGMLILRSKQLAKQCFFTQYLKSPFGRKQIDFISFGSAQPQLTKKDVTSYILSVPYDIAEQTKIASYFQHLDSLISLQKRELDKLRNMKKACLSKMFV